MFRFVPGINHVERQMKQRTIFFVFKQDHFVLLWFNKSCKAVIYFGSEGFIGFFFGSDRIYGYLSLTSAVCGMEMGEH